MAPQIKEYLVADDYDCIRSNNRFKKKEQCYGVHHRVADTVALWLRSILTAEGMALLTPAVAWWYSVENGSFLTVALALQELLNGLLKFMLQQPRPSWVNAGVSKVGGKLERDYSFPSSHAQTAATWATALVLFSVQDDKMMTSVLAISLCLASGLARVHLGVHTILDVVVGWMVGIVFTSTLWWLDPIHWYMELSQDPTSLVKYGVWVTIVVVPLSLLHIIRTLVPPPSDAVLEKWEENAAANLMTTPGRRNSKIIYGRTEQRLAHRHLAKYYFQVFSLLGGAMGASWSLDAFYKQTLAYVQEDCSLTHDGSMIPMTRCVWCYSVLAFLILPLAFGLPKLLLLEGGEFSRTKSATQVVASAVQVLGFTAVGLWMMYGCPYTSTHWFGLECPVLSSCDHVEVLPETAEIMCPKTYEFEGCDMDGPNVWLPSDVKELQEMIVTAHKEKVSLRVRAACHSTPGASHKTSFYEQSFSNSTQPVNKKAKFLSLMHKNFAKYELVEEGGKKYAVVGAGITLGENLIFNRTWSESLTAQLWEDGLAVDDIGGTTQLSLGGFLSVGANGPGKHNTIQNNVLGLRFINGLGEKVEVWRNSTAVSAEELPFDAFLVNLGLLGVLYEVVLQPNPRYCVVDNLYAHVNVERKSFDDLAKEFHEPDYSRFLIDYFQGGIAAFVFNYTKSYDIDSCDHLGQFEASSQGQLAALDVLYGLKMDTSCFVEQLRVAATTKFGRQSNHQGDICSVDVYRRMLETYRSIGGDSMHLETCFKAVEKQWQLHGFDSDHLSSMTSVLNEDCAVPALMDFSSRGSNPFRYYLGIAVDDWTMAYRNLGYDMTEMWFSLDRYKLNQVLQAAQEIAFELKSKFALVFPAPEMYMAPASDAWLSPCHGSNACVRMGLFFPSRHYSEMQEYFDMMHQAFVSRGLHPVFHWGKYISRDESILRTMRAQLPKLDDFLQIRTEQDPHEIFLTEDWKLYLGITG